MIITPLEVIMNSKSEWGQGSRIPRITVRREEHDQTHPQDPGDTVSQGRQTNKRPSLPNKELQDKEFFSDSRKRPRFQMTDFFVSSSRNIGFSQGAPTHSAGPKTKEWISQDTVCKTSSEKTMRALLIHGNT